MFELIFAVLIGLYAMSRTGGRSYAQACQDDDIPYYSLHLTSGDSMDR